LVHRGINVLWKMSKTHKKPEVLDLDTVDLFQRGLERRSMSHQERDRLLGEFLGLLRLPFEEVLERSSPVLRHLIRLIFLSAARVVPKVAEQRLAMAQALVDANPTAAKFTQLGDIYYKLGDYPKAIGAYERACNFSPVNPNVFFLLGYAYGFTGDYVHAYQCFKSLLALKPKSQLRTRIYQNCLSLAKQCDQQDALLFYNFVVTGDPKNLEAWHGLVDIAFQLNDEESALKYLCRALEHHPDHEYFLFNRAALLAETEEWCEFALQDLHRLLYLNPDHKPGFELLVKICGYADELFQPPSFDFAYRDAPSSVSEAEGFVRGLELSARISPRNLQKLEDNLIRKGRHNDLIGWEEEDLN